MVKVPAKDEVEYLKEGDDVVKKTTSYAVNASTGNLTPTEKKEIFKQSGAKSTVVVTQLEPSVRYEKDVTRAKGETNVTTDGTPGTRTVTTTYTVNPTDGSLIPHEGQPVIKPSTPTVVKVSAKDEVEYLKEGDNVVKKTTSYAVNSSTGALTPTEKKEIFKQNGAKSTVAVTKLEPSVRYEKDATKAKGEDNVTTVGTPGTSTVTTTYTVNPADGSLIPYEGQPVTIPSTPTVVKVPAKDEVEYLKEGDDVVKKTITYAVNASTGSLTPTETTEIFKRNGAKSKVIVTPLEPSVRYEKDATRAKGEANVTTAGTPGTSTVTTTYTVNPTDGSLVPHEEPAVVVPSTPTVVKVPAKDEVEYLKDGDDVVKKTTTYEVNASTGILTPAEKKEVFKQDGSKTTVVVTPLEPSVRYEKDATRAKGGANVTVAGTSGTRTVTTTYTVNPTDGSLIPHEEPAVVVPAKPTVVKVPAQDEVEYLKEGDDVVKKTTSYQVNASTGALTPTEKKEVFKQNGAKSTVVVTSLEPSVRYEKDATKAKGEANVTTAGTPGTRTVTTTYTVNPADGSLIPHEGKPVIKLSTPTVVKVPAKDEVEYLKDGDDVVKKTTSYQVNSSTGALTPTVRKDITSPNGAKSTVVVTSLEPSVRYEKDATRAKGEANVTVAGTPGTRTVTTTYAVNPTDGSLIPHEGQPVIKLSTTTVVKVSAKDEVVETPIEPEVEYVKDVEKDFGTPDQRTEGEKSKTVTTTTYYVDPKDGHITEHVGNPVFIPAGKTIVKVGAKTKVEQSKDSEGRDVIDTTTYEVNPKTGKVTPTTVRTYGTTKEPTVEKRVVTSPVVYEKDGTKEKGTAPTTVKGEDGEDTVTTIYTVDPNTGKITASEGQPVRTKEPTNTIVKVAAKDKVETTEIPSPKKYVKDDTRDKGQDNVEEAGQAGSRTTTTTYEVNPADGTITERVGEPVVVNPTVTIVKVPAKDKVVETPIEPEVEYVKDVEKDFGTPDQRTEGEKSKTVTTTTYYVDPKDGHITEHVGNPVFIPAGKTIVKVGAKTKVEQSKNPEGRDVIDTTTYEVDPKTGKVTPTTVRTYGKTKEPKVEIEQDPKTGEVTVTPKKPDGSTYPPGTKVEISGEDGKGKVANSDLPDVEKPGIGKTTEPGKPSVEVPNVTTPPKVTIFENGLLPDSIELPELMIDVRWIDEDGNVLKPSVKSGNEKDAEHGSILGYEFVRTVIAENEPVLTHIFSKVSGSTHSNLATPPKVTIFENGVLPDSIELPELMIDVRWIDESGNVLKPSVKTGNEKNAEHGSIPGYEFVRTVIAENEPVLTHIFRKVSGSTNTNTIPVTPVLPDTNGNSGHDTLTPTIPAPTPIPDEVTPNTNHEETRDTIDNRAKVNDSQNVLPTPTPNAVTPNADQVDTKTTVDNGAKSNDSQTVLPNTGTESNATLASLGLLGMLGGLGLAFGKKKEEARTKRF